MKNSITYYIILFAVIAVALLMVIKILPLIFYLLFVAVIVGVIYALSEIYAGRKTVEDFKVIIESWIEKIKQFLN
jgi:hypothetical protein